MQQRIVYGIVILGLLAGGAFPAFADPFKQAVALDRQNFLAESIPEWKQFLETGPDKNRHIYASIKITIAYFKTGNIGEAIKAAQSLAAAYPDEFNVQFNLGNMLGATHQYTEGVQAFQKAASLMPEEGLARVGHGLCLFGAEQSEQSLTVLREVRKLFKQQKNIAWYQNVRIMIGQIKGFALYPHDFSELWRTNNLKKIRETYEAGVLRALEKNLNL